ncbi:MAG: sugar transferase [Planctomycetaceae bacterium]|nr:sugar transferase [Planctomycetaceae bacterium]
MIDSLDPADPKHTQPARESSQSRIILIGARRDARKLLQHLESHSRRGVTIIGFVDAGHHEASRPRLHGRQLAVCPSSHPVPVLGGLDRLNELVDRTRATDLVVAIPSKPRRHLLPRLAEFTKSNVAVHWVSVTSTSEQPAGVGWVSAAQPTTQRPISSWVGSASQARLTHPTKLRSLPWARIAKRLCDVVISATTLLLLSPLFAAVAVAILVTSGRPIFYTQERVGQGGRRFRIIKFRSMRNDAERDTGPIWASTDDNRCTPIGEWLRHTNIDELPQLFNVLKGQMSLVGPRPERPVFVDQFRAAMPDYELRHAVPAGMTGWAQVHGWRGRTSLRKRLQYDLDYIRRWSFWLDFVVMLMTIQHVAWGKTTWKLSRPQKHSEL